MYFVQQKTPPTSSPRNQTQWVSWENQSKVFKKKSCFMTPLSLFILLQDLPMLPLWTNVVTGRIIILCYGLYVIDQSTMWCIKLCFVVLSETSPVMCCWCKMSLNNLYWVKTDLVIVAFYSCNSYQTFVINIWCTLITPCTYYTFLNVAPDYKGWNFHWIKTRDQNKLTTSGTCELL